MSLQQRANARFQRRDFAGALEALQAMPGELFGATQKSFKIAENYLRLGIREAADEAYRKAEIALRKLVQERPRDRFARANLAYALAMLGQRTEALRYLEEALEAAPEG